ncbi:MAG: alpha-amylase [Myxococcales bacterium]|nr:alpha-amylase [Myxococcales bacterium]
MRRLCWIAAALSACGPPGPKVPVTSALTAGEGWHRRVAIYELSVRSYQDSDGDGIGDLRGLIQRLDHLAELGVGAIWLMPMFPSPLKDSGYDVADYLGVHPDYGTLEDFERLLGEAHRRGLKVMLDLVVNHTSTEHEWFQSSRASRTGEKADWYVWSDGPGPGCEESNVIFGEERWTFDPARGQYYFHQFFSSQPDLNYRSPELAEAVLGVARRWLELGVDGFRLDVPHQYVENWPKCWHQPQTLAFHQRLREEVDKAYDRVLLGEVCCGREEVLRYAGSDRLQLVFYFVGMHATWSAVKWGDASKLAEHLRFAVQNTPPGGLHANTLGNHDIFRTPTTMAAEASGLKLAATLQMTAPGAPVIYYGEEIGMRDGATWAVDIRDYARTPMQWDDTPSAGFTTGTPWLALSEGTAALNVRVQAGREGSLLSHYKRLLALRNRSLALQEGAYEPLATQSSSLVFWRRHPAGDRLVALHFGASGTIAVRAEVPEGWSALVDELSGEEVGEVRGAVWTATQPARAGWVLKPR